MSDCNCNDKSCSNCPASEEMQDLQVMVTKLNKDRAEGLKRLEEKVNSLAEAPVLTAQTVSDPKVLVNTLREQEAALNASLLIIQAQNTLIDMIISDLGNTISNLQTHAQSSFLTAAHLQTLLTLLEKKGNITNQEMQQTYQEILQLQSKQ